MDVTGPLGNVKKYLGKLPAPGTYEIKEMHNCRAPELRSRLPDHTGKLNEKVRTVVDRTLVLVSTNTTVWPLVPTT